MYLTPHNKSIIREYYIDLMKEISKDVEKIVDNITNEGSLIYGKYILKNKLIIDLTICLAKNINIIKSLKCGYYYDRTKFFKDLLQHINISYYSYTFTRFRAVLETYIYGTEIYYF